MPEFPSIFPFWWIALTAAIAFVLSLIAMLVLRRRSVAVSASESAIIALVVGVSVLVWRLAGNAAGLNEDTLPGISPNDLLCPVFTYMFLRLYSSFRPQIDPANWGRVVALLTFISFAVNATVI